ncbi:MAG: hypothetical protein GY760_16945 [Deltaproteobacteria bacterium]|nr:hypothetical protein [Deltaproteobacteria bacterium]
MAKSDKSLGAEYLEERESIRVEKLGQKINLIAFLLPCVLVIILIIAYVDLKNRLDNVNETGASKVENLSMDLDSQVRGLLGKYKNAEKNFRKEIASSKKSVSLLGRRLNQNKKNIGRIFSTKADKKTLQKEIEESREILATLKKDISKSRKLLSGLQKKTGSNYKELQKSSDEIEKAYSRIEENKNNLDDLYRSKADKKRVIFDIKAVRTKNQKNVKDLNAVFEKKYAALLKKIKNLEKKLSKLKQQKVKKKVTKKKKTTTKKSVKKPNPGEIIESDIK